MLASESHGSGIPLLFLHAFPLSRRMWANDKPAFHRHFQFITMDLPGFGESAPVGETATMEAMAAQVLETMNKLKITDKCVVSGLSMGGYVALQLLKLAPERFRAAAFISTRANADSDEGRARRFQMIDFIQKEGLKPFAERMLPGLLGKSTLGAIIPMVAQQVKTWIESADPKAVCAALRGMAERPNMNALLPTLDMPMLFLAGEEDATIPPAEMEKMSKLAMNGKYCVLPRAGHLLNLEEPVQFQETFLHFLKGHVL